MHVLFCCPRLRTAREDSAIEALTQIKGYYQRGMFNARICNIIEITPVIYERSICKNTFHIASPCIVSSQGFLGVSSYSMRARQIIISSSLWSSQGPHLLLMIFNQAFSLRKCFLEVWLSPMIDRKIISTALRTGTVFGLVVLTSQYHPVGLHPKSNKHSESTKKWSFFAPTSKYKCTINK